MRKLSFEDRLFGRLGKLSPEEERDVATFYEGLRMSTTEAGRLAFRHEGKSWNCYFARIGDMEGAILIGSIMLRVVEENDAIREQFKACMKEALAHILKQAVGEDVEAWDEREAAP